MRDIKFISAAPAAELGRSRAGGVVDRSDLESKLQAVTDALANELIAITPESMNEIQFEIVSTDDGGADIGLMEIHPEAPYAVLSPVVYDCCSKYLPLVKQYAPGWRRSLLTLREGDGDWKATVDFEYKKLAVAPDSGDQPRTKS